MAGDWMKIELELPDKPEVHYIANALNLDPDAVVGKLIRVWQWFNKHTLDGNAHGVTFSLLDRITCVTGFGEALMLAGWLEQHDKTLHMPKFDRHTSESSKKRALTNQRQSRFRNATVTQSALPREEKSNTPISPSFDAFWSAYPKKRSKGQALNAWRKLSPDEQLTARIIAAVEQAKTQDDWRKEQGKYIPHPATWLNARGWEDETVIEFPREKRLAL